MFSPRSTPITWRQKLERAADVAVAFATLESITSVRELLGAPAAQQPPHPHHRAPLQARARTGRPGAVPGRPLVCTTAPAQRPRSRNVHRALH